ncbi:hypothetical protein TPA0598_09_02500 [Streptomyces lydicamycinicus]|uniref:Uncharacterized protein n=1 Tax=Streptomyces lydicamycinicus TaxID=1546107 RepID=A0A0P4RE80_9ACTN|nr:hypothetical protein TPA0598_09_02500 [Streptomyces lydicamycinicus]
MTRSANGSGRVTRRARRRRPLYGGPGLRRARVPDHRTCRSSTFRGHRTARFPTRCTPSLRPCRTPSLRTHPGLAPRLETSPDVRPHRLAPVRSLILPPRDRKPQDREREVGGAAGDRHQGVAQHTSGGRGVDVMPQFPAEGGVAVRAQRRGEAGLRDRARRSQDPLYGGHGRPAAGAATVRAPGSGLRGRPGLRPLRGLRTLGIPRPPPPPEQPHPPSLLPFSPLHQGGDL